MRNLISNDEIHVLKVKGTFAGVIRDLNAKAVKELYTVRAQKKDI